MQKFLIVLGLCLILGISANAQSPSEAKPSFDCAKAKSNVEKIICNDKYGQLQNLDRYMAEVYTQLTKELKVSKLPDKEQRLKDLLDSQRAFIKSLNKIDRADFLQYDYDEEDTYRFRFWFMEESYENRITDLLKLLGKVLDSNNKELCEYARQHDDEFDESKWQEVPPSVNPPYSIGFCTFGTSSRYGMTTDFCTEKGEIIKEEIAKAFKHKGGEKFYFLDNTKMYKRKIDINNDGVPENLIFISGDYYEALWIYKNGKLDKASDKIYGDDLHFYGTGTRGILQGSLDSLAAGVFDLYAMPSNKISQPPKFEFGYPILGYLYYGVMEFKGKNYITLYNRRFQDDEKSTYPTERIYLLKGDKLELKCTYEKRY
ncbi:lysozyme inhibitor LprI family protein [Campylobacter taeniopygiae]|uniref:Lysozyme inhibitor LprI N-terminal domain-containing protein n=1 Tax=Campylobacter taeniopygiae TaxID=2510188 RepID=A0ABY2THB7_9BACT|nr:DUF1311 domain-containing protein [Campylobacter taeniopygiae]TKX33222.1 hypothetical protein CQA75_08660 [Campylobacter taeniopygiae]